MSAEFLAMSAGVVLSLVFSYVPAAQAKFNLLDATGKRLVMLGLLFGIAAGVAGLGCAGLGPDFGLAVTCNRAGIIAIFQAFFYAALANQTAYLLTKPGE